MDYTPHRYKNQNGIQPSFKYKSKRALWFNSNFTSDFVLIDNKIYEISFDTNPFEIYKFNRLKVLSYIRDSNQSRPIQVKLKFPLAQSRQVVNTDLETYPIIYNNHTGARAMHYNDKYSVRLVPQQIPRFIFRLDDNYTNYFNNLFGTITNAEPFNTSGYSYLIFRSSGSFVLKNNLLCDIFMIGGGGAGGSALNSSGGGSGACIIAINQSLNSGSFNITIGAGGIATNNSAGGNGGDTSIGSLFIAKGGGGGGYGNGLNGGSGGGAGFGVYTGNVAYTGGSAVTTNVVNGNTNIGPSTTSTYAVLGNQGGNVPAWTFGGDYNPINTAGGGGIGTAGGNASTSACGVGGDGIYQITIGGITYNLKNHFSPNSSFGVNDGSGNFFIGGGGGGGGYQTSSLTIAGGKGGGGAGKDGAGGVAGVSAVANTGSGGGGSEANANPGGNGGSGLVIIKFNSSNRIEGMTAQETLVQTTNASIPVTVNSKYVINYQTPVDLPKGTYETIFANGGITFKSKPDYSYPTTSNLPLVWYKFDGSQLLYDSSGNNNLINNNGVNIDTSIYIRGDSSASFIASLSQYFTMPKLNYNTINTTNGISFSFWGRFKSTTGTYAAVFQFIGSGGHCLLYRDGGNNFAFYNEIVSPADVKYITTSGINNFDNTWRHYTWTISTTGIWNIYINGSATNNNFSGNIISSGLNANQSYVSSIGRRTDTNHNIDGNIDDFRIYDYVLSPNEVYDLYNGNTDRSYPLLKDVNNTTINPTAWYQFDNSTNNMLNDSSGNGYTLTNTGVVLNGNIYAKGNGSAYFNPSNTTDGKYLTATGIDLGSKSYSISLWVYLTEAVASKEYWFFSTAFKATANQNVMIGFLTNDKVRFSYYFNDLDYNYSFANDVNKWVHWSFIFDNVAPTGNNRFIFRNGVQVAGHRSSVLTTPNTTINIGRWDATTNTIFYGYLDDIRIYNGVALTSTQVNELYNGRIGIYSPPSFMLGVEMEDEKLSPINTISTNNRTNDT